MAYVKKAFARLARLGIRDRRVRQRWRPPVPEGFSEEETFKQLVEFGTRIAPERAPMA